MTHWKHRLRACATHFAPAVAVACVLLAVPARAQLPTLGDTSEMTSSSEGKLGEQIARELYRDPDYLDDPVLDEYVLEIWTRLLAAARTRGELTSELDERYAWQVLLGKDRIINAFALPGGWMGLQLGLVNVTASRDELAAVLAHELSHVTQRHISRLMTQQNRQTPWLVAAMILGALAVSKSPDAGNAVIAGGQAMAMQNQLNFSRDMEREADRVGFGVMTQAGFQPQGFVTMFEKLQQAARLNDNGNFPYLRTHPMTTERIAEAQSRQQLVPRSAAPAGAGPGARHDGRPFARALESRRRFPARLCRRGGRPAPGRRRSGAGGAGALRGRAGEREAARTGGGGAPGGPPRRAHRRRPEGRAPGPPAVGGDRAWPAGDAARTAALLDPNAPGRPEMMLLSQARIQTGHAGEAAQRLQTWVALNPRDAGAWQLLASAYTAQGQALRAIRAEAEAQVAHLDYQAAMDRFKAAQDLARRALSPGEHIEASIIDTRARQVASLLREQALER